MPVVSRLRVCDRPPMSMGAQRRLRLWVFLVAAFGCGPRIEDAGPTNDSGTGGGSSTVGSSSVAGSETTLDPAAEQAMRQWLAANPSKAHQYGAARFGLTEAGIRERYADYIDTYGVRLEN